MSPQPALSSRWLCTRCVSSIAPQCFIFYLASVVLAQSFKPCAATCTAIGSCASSYRYGPLPIPSSSCIAPPHPIPFLAASYPIPVFVAWHRRPHVLHSFSRDRRPSNQSDPDSSILRFIVWAVTALQIASPMSFLVSDHRCPATQPPSPSTALQPPSHSNLPATQPPNHFSRFSTTQPYFPILHPVTYVTYEYEQTHLASTCDPRCLCTLLRLPPLIRRCHSARRSCTAPTTTPEARLLSPAFIDTLSQSRFPANRRMSSSFGKCIGPIPPVLHYLCCCFIPHLTPPSFLKSHLQFHSCNHFFPG
jgi:hypothetical protein